MISNLFSDIKSFGENVYPEAKMKSIFYYILESLQDTTLIILMVCAAVSLIFCVFVSEEDECLLDSIGIFVAVVLVTSVSSLNNWQKERQFRALNKVKVRLLFFIRVTRNRKIERSKLFVEETRKKFLHTIFKSETLLNLTLVIKSQQMVFSLKDLVLNAMRAR
jgi:magnesium-transporting ATPase (P-type)